MVNRRHVPYPLSTRHVEKRRGHLALHASPISHQLEHATWRRLPLSQETGQVKMAFGRDLYSRQEQVGISISFGIEWMRMIKKWKMAGLEGEALNTAKQFYALAA